MRLSRIATLTTAVLAVFATSAALADSPRSYIVQFQDTAVQAPPRGPVHDRRADEDPRGWGYVDSRVIERVQSTESRHGIQALHAYSSVIKGFAAALSDAQVARLKADRQLRSDAPALGQLVEQITLTLLFSLDYQRVLGSKGEVRTVVYQIMMLVAPHLRSEAQRSAESLAQRYLGPE